MEFVMLVGVEVVDEEGYAAYRAAMEPILRGVGGSFGYDLRVAEVLRPVPAPSLNRLFTIHFPDASARDSFFADPAYLEVKRRHFEASVGAVTRIAEFSAAPSS